MNVTPFLDPPDFWPSRPFGWNIHTNLITIDTSARDTAWATSVVKGKTYIVGAALVPTANTSSKKDGLVIVMIKMEGEHGTTDINFESWRSRMWAVRHVLVPPGQEPVVEIPSDDDAPTVVICIKEGVIGAAFE